MAGPALVLALLLVLPLPDVSGETHSLSYLYTVQSKSSPEGGSGFSVVTLLDDDQIDSYSSNSTDTDGTRTPKQDWVKKMNESEWKDGTEKMKSDGIELYKIFELQMKDLGHNASDGHVLQWTIRCEGEEHPDGSLSSVNGTNEFRYDRKTLISYNCTSKKWSREEEWKAGGGQDPAKKCEDCMEWLKLYLHHNTTDIKQSGESSNCQISTGGLVVGMTVGVTVLLAAVLPVLAGIVVILKGEEVPVVCVVPTQAGGDLEEIPFIDDVLSIEAGKLQRVQGTMNSLQYQEILEENVMESVTNLRLGRRWTFQQDNDPKHTSKSTRAWLNMKGWNILEWPSQSPDLNPIENLWWDLKKAVPVRKPKNVTELEAFAHEEWAKIPIGRCKTLVSSYASRLKAVITGKGCCTKY
ncbi:hypothetical protein NFI96_023147 [Prochilodus magdalenae]|nr:hypothetical protein NFI96_023147 [Prochilodus magdalenae]